MHTAHFGRLQLFKLTFVLHLTPAQKLANLHKLRTTAIIIVQWLCCDTFGGQLDTNKYKPKEKALLSNLSRLGLQITNVRLKNID